MTDVMLRSHWVSPDQAWANFKQVIVPWCKERFASGQSLELEFRLHEDAKTDRQRRYLHGVVLRQIAIQARPNGQAFPMDVWKTYFKDKLLGVKSITSVNPLTGRKSRRRHRVGTEELGVKRYAAFIEQVMAEAVMELGVVFPDEWTDHDTGEVMRRTDYWVGHR